MVSFWPLVGAGFGLRIMGIIIEKTKSLKKSNYNVLYVDQWHVIYMYIVSLEILNLDKFNWGTKVA